MQETRSKVERGNDMPIKRMKKLLDDQGVRYVILRHSPAFTAQGVASSAHIPSKGDGEDGDDPRGR